MACVGEIAQVVRDCKAKRFDIKLLRLAFFAKFWILFSTFTFFFSSDCGTSKRRALVAGPT